jgi:hypothetical protein
LPQWASDVTTTCPIRDQWLGCVQYLGQEIHSIAIKQITFNLVCEKMDKWVILFGFFVAFLSNLGASHYFTFFIKANDTYSSIKTWDSKDQRATILLNIKEVSKNACLNFFENS